MSILQRLAQRRKKELNTPPMLVFTQAIDGTYSPGVTGCQPTGPLSRADVQQARAKVIITIVYD